MLEPSIAEILQDRLGDKIEDYLIPPPVFELMRGEFLVINWQNPQNSYPRRKRTGYYRILPLRVQILLKLGTHVASYGIFSKNKCKSRANNNQVPCSG
jgi:hypothetical protein